jgi:GNAT superfamily N-acetyltransferase
MLVFEKNLPKNIDYLKLFHIFCRMTTSINPTYILKLFDLTDSKIVLYSMESSSAIVDIENCPCGLIYQTETKENELNIYITFIATKYKYRGCGYASLCINEFINFVKQKYLGKYKTIVIVLDSLITAVTFYENIGFKWITTEQKYNSIFDIDEKNKNEHFIMVYEVK